MVHSFGLFYVKLAVGLAILPEYSTVFSGETLQPLDSF